LEIFEATLALLATALLLSLVAGRLAIPYPSVLVVGGLGLGLFQLGPPVELNPALAFVLFLPPILFEAAYYTSWRDFLANAMPIGSLAVVLVALSTYVVAVVADRLIPELPIQAAFVLGAIVSPPDAAAATAVLSRVKLPRRIVTIVEGESLVNDAVALVLYNFAVELTVVGDVSPTKAAVTLVLSVIGSTALGLAIGWAWSKVAERITDPLVTVTASFIVAYGAYIAAEQLHGSGVLAVVAAGLHFAWRAPGVLAPDVRLSAGAVWRLVIFVLNAIAFVLIGLQLPQIVAALPDYSIGTLALDAGVIAGTVILVRLAWVVGVSQLLRRLGGERARHKIGDWRESLIIGWSGMRGLVSLAAALALPETVNGGAPFPARALVLFLAFAVILATLVLQGLTLGSLIRVLKVKEDDGAAQEERLARVGAATAAIETIDTLAENPALPREVLDRLRLLYIARIQQASDDRDPADPSNADFADAVRLAAIAAERKALLDLRRRRIIGDGPLHAIQRELDLTEIALKRRQPGYSRTTWLDLAQKTAQAQPSRPPPAPPESGAAESG
jgi:CPA1 family monovalent cation:H+ antiporter